MEPESQQSKFKNMKKYLGIFLAIFAMALTSVGQIVTIDGGDTAGPGGPQIVRSGIGRHATSINPTVTVTDTTGPVISDASFQAFALEAVRLIKETGTFPPGFKTSLADPRLLTYVSWSSFVNGSTVWSFVDLKAESGKTVSLSQITFVCRSLDGSANSLGKTTTFANRDYTTTAIGIRADGSLITSGPSTQECVRVIVGIGWKSYTATTPAQVQEVREYLAQFSDWGITSTASAGSTTTSKTLTTVPPTETPPHLTIIKEGNNIRLKVVYGSGTYILQSSTLNGGLWTNVRTGLTVGEEFVVENVSGSNNYRLQQQ